VARYTDDQRIAALGLLSANAGNYEKTAREAKVDKKTLRKWAATPLSDSPELPVIKAQLTASFLDSVKQVREAASRRMLELIPKEMDLHKVAGALKISNDAARLEAGEATSRQEVSTVERKPIDDGALRELRTRLNAEYN
jgi:transposase-like protein